MVSAIQLLILHAGGTVRLSNRVMIVSFRKRKKKNFYAWNIHQRSSRQAVLIARHDIEVIILIFILDIFTSFEHLAQLWFELVGHFLLIFSSFADGGNEGYSNWPKEYGRLLE